MQWTYLFEEVYEDFSRLPASTPTNRRMTSRERYHVMEEKSKWLEAHTPPYDEDEDVDDDFDLEDDEDEIFKQIQEKPGASGNPAPSRGDAVERAIKHIDRKIKRRACPPLPNRSTWTFQSVLNARGAQGWELVHAERCTDVRDQEPCYWRVIFKRPRDASDVSITTRASDSGVPNLEL
jgi:hypothetical protein